MRRIFAAIIIIIFAVMVFLLVYIPAQDFLRRILGPNVTGALGTIGSMITGSALWRNVITVWPYSFGIGCVITFFITAIAAYYWHTGWNWVRTHMVKSAIQESGMGYREVKGAPVTTTVTNPNPTVTKAETEPTPEKEKE